jgi:hypothetical protein
MVDGGDDDNSDVDAVTGLTWQQNCGPEEVTKLRNRMGSFTNLQSSSPVATRSGSEKSKYPG